VKVTIELPLDRYDRLRDKCEESSPEFSVLMNGCIDRRPNGNGNEFERFIQILCDKSKPRHFSISQPDFVPMPFPPSNALSNFRPITERLIGSDSRNQKLSHLQIDQIGYCTFLSDELA
jgi:hypothetical protein